MKMIIGGVIQEEVMKARDYWIQLVERWVFAQKSNKLSITFEREGDERYEERDLVRRE